MPGRNLATVCKVVLALTVLLLATGPTLAYVGPGAGITFSSYALTLLVCILVAVSAVLLWPVYALFRWIRRRRNESTTTSLPE